MQTNGGCSHKEHFYEKSEDAVEEVHGLGTPLHHHIGIDFGAMDVGASQQAACGVEVAASGEGHRGEGVTQAVHSRQLQYDWYLHLLHSKKPMGQGIAGANYITYHKAQPYNYNCQQE